VWLDRPDAEKKMRTRALKLIAAAALVSVGACGKHNGTTDSASGTIGTNSKADTASGAAMVDSSTLRTDSARIADSTAAAKMAKDTATKPTRKRPYKR
jgi:hypothetical protein